MRRILTGILIVALVSVGCASKYRLHRDRLDQISPWPFHRGDLTAVANSQGPFEGHLNEVWKRTSGDKPVGPLTISHGVLVYPGSKKKIRFYETETGKYRGRIKAKGLPQSGIVVADSVALFANAPRNGELRAVNLLKRKTLWTLPVKDACPGPILVNNSLIISSTEGRTFAIAVEDGQTLWTYDADGGLIAGASLAGGRLFQPDDQGRVHVISVGDGQPLYRVEVDEPMIGPVAVAKLAYVTTLGGRVFAFEPETGQIVWQTDLTGPFWTGPSVDDDRVFVGHSGGHLLALDAVTGHTLWTCEIGEVIKASPVTVGEFVVVATATGLVVTVDIESGSIVDRVQLKGSVDFSPVVDGGRVFVATDEGIIICFGE